MTLFAELKSISVNHRHHAVLLVLPPAANETIVEKYFATFVKDFCKIDLFENAGVSVFDIAVHHPDIFIADRQRKILRLEELDKIKELCLYPPSSASRRLLYIENCERMNINATNALLKSLEEPPAQVLFLLTTSRLHSMMPTIVSRCHKIVLQDPENTRKNIADSLAPEDLNFLKAQIENFNLDAFFIGNSLGEALNRQINAQKIKEVVTAAEKLGKEYSADVLRDILVHLVSARVKNKPEFIPLARFIFANISEWKEHELFNLSNQLWLTRILLGFQQSS